MLLKVVDIEPQVSAWLQNQLGISASVADVLDRAVILIGISIAAVSLDFVIKKWLMPAIEHFVRYTDTKWDDMLFDAKVITHFSKLLPVFLARFFLPLAFPDNSLALFWMEKICAIFLIVVIGQLLYALFDVTDEFLDEDKMESGHPYSLVFQVLKILVFLICSILVVSHIIDKSPTVLLTGLGASAAILTLVFKDSIVGLVSGVQLTVNEMLRIGDWISLPSQNINGYVIEVKLHTVKIRNFDMSIVTIPPSNLLSNTFINWRNMQDGGARRICRAINIDISTIGFCSEEMLKSLRSFDLLVPVLDEIEKNGGKMPDGTRPTNIGLFRAYLLAFIEDFPLSYIDTDNKYFHMVRQLAPTSHGLPLELYFFIKEVRWTEYERIQSDVFDQVFAAVPLFGLRVFQDISDTKNLN